MIDAPNHENKTQNAKKYNTTETDETQMNVSLDCSSLKCIAEGGPNQLQCCSCQRWVHYKSTQLPPYMLQAFISRRIKKYYYCGITVPKIMLTDLYPQSGNQEEVKRVRREINMCLPQ